MACPSCIGIYREALVFLGTAGVVIPLMARLRISPVVGFLIAGLILVPNALGRLDDFWPWLGLIAITSQEAIDRLAELGVAFLLFTIGLELSFDRLWTMRRLVFGLGMSQVVLTATAIGVTAFAFGNLAEASLVIGACLALSSTAIVLQLLAEQQRLTSTVGRSVFFVLLAQDLDQGGRDRWMARLFGCTWPVAIESSLLLAGGGEFAFLALSLGSSGGLMSNGVEQFMLLVASGTMLLTPVLARLARRFGLLATKASPVEIGYSDPGPTEAGRTIVVGHGRIGRIVCDVLEKEGLSFIAIEREIEVVTHGRHEGRHVVYGNAVQHEFLRRCGLAEAPAVILTMHEPSEAEHVLRAIRAERADVPIVARARSPARCRVRRIEPRPRNQFVVRR
jgi:hypothetical protein